jgi:glycine oxidase
MVDAVFVGGGIIGLSAAYRAQQRGLEVLVLERDRAGSGASRVAAGVLAPDGDALGRRSLDLYPDFVDELGDVGFWRCGMLDVTTGSFSEHDASVDPRRLVEALARRVPIREGVEVAGITRDSVTTLGGERIQSQRVVVCAGAWSGIAGVAVRPVKGQVVRLRGELSVQHMLQREHIYIVPRQNGEVVVGATIEECGFDATVTQHATDELLHEASDVLPEIAKLEIVDVSAGLRPAMPDDRPLIGELDDGVLVATGHYRNGILLAPVTAEATVALLLGEQPPAEALPFGP